MKKEKHQQWRKGFPYYKVQYWDHRVSAWHDIQKRFGSKAEARAHGIKLGIRYRIMEIERTKRRLV